MSRITAKQIQVVQIARRQLGLDDADYREILRVKGGVSPDATGHVSSKRLTQRGFDQVMAHFEHMGFRKHPGQSGGYWRDKQFRRGVLASERECHLIRQLSREVTRYPLDKLCRKFSDGHTGEPELLTARQAHNLIEMLKATSKRAAQGGVARDAKEGAGLDAGGYGVAPHAAPRTGETYQDVSVGSTDWDLSQSDDVPF